jgi:hypothetical protein
MNRREHVKHSGDSHPPEFELDPDVPATPAALGVQSRMRMDPSVTDIEFDDPATAAGPATREASGSAQAAPSTGKVLTAVVVGWFVLKMLRRRR